MKISNSEILHRPRQAIKNLHEQVTSGTYPYLDFRVHIHEVDGIHPNLKIIDSLYEVGGIWHIFKRKYVDPKGTPFEDKEPATQWYLNKNQANLLRSLPKVLDQDIEIPILEIIAFGGRRSGKTEGGTFYGVAMSIIRAGSIGEVWGYDFVNNVDQADGLRDKIMKHLPDNFFGRYDKIGRQLHLKNGSVIKFKSSGKPRSARSGAPDWAILDEPSHYDNPQHIMDSLAPAMAENSAPIIMITSPSGYDAVYYRTQKRFSKNKYEREALHFIDFGSMFGNCFLNQKAKRSLKVMAEKMSNDQYNQEILGKVINIKGNVFYNYDRKEHIIDEKDLKKKDITYELTNELFPGFKQGFDIVAGMDFNENPMSFVAAKIYEGGYFHYFEEKYLYDASSITFISNFLIPWMKEQYPNLSEAESKKKILIVGDASGQWQEFGKQAQRGLSEISAFKHFKSFGFHIIPPKHVPTRRRNKRDSERQKRRSYYTANPARGERMNSARSRMRSHKNEIYVGLDPACTETIKMVEGLTLHKSMPDLNSDFIHAYDAFSYPLYRFFPFSNLDNVADIRIFEAIKKLSKSDKRG